MTIYTAPQSDKDKAKLLSEESDILDGSMTSLNIKDDAQDPPGPRVVEVTYFKRNGRSFYVHLLFALAVLVILACGALGAVVFYRHLHKKVYSGKCRTVYFDTSYRDGFKAPIAEPRMGDNRPSNVQMDFVEEDIVVMKDELIEELHTPAFDEVRESYVRHDFMLNLTAIVDHRYKQCFVMKLNRTAIAPPKNLIELLHLILMAQSYLRKASVIRQDFDVAHAIEDISYLGKHIARDCAPYPTLWLEKRVGGVYKRSVETTEEEVAYAMMSNHPDQQVIYKLFIHQKMEQVVENDKVSSAA